MLSFLMRPQGTFKLAHRSRLLDAGGPFDAILDPLGRGERRVQRILESLRSEIVESGARLRIRQVFRTPREIYRLELELPELGYQRTTLLDREALEELLAADEVREAVLLSPTGI